MKTWFIIKVLIIIAAFLFQLYVVFQAESLAEETGDYTHATYEMLWLIMLFFVGESIIRDDKDG